MESPRSSPRVQKNNITSKSEQLLAESIEPFTLTEVCAEMDPLKVAMLNQIRRKIDMKGTALISTRESKGDSLEVDRLRGEIYEKYTFAETFLRKLFRPIDVIPSRYSELKITGYCGLSISCLKTECLGHEVNATIDNRKPDDSKSDDGELNDGKLSDNQSADDQEDNDEFVCTTEL